MAYPYVLSDDQWKGRLNPTEFQILRQAGTERYGVGKYNKVFPKTGYFACRACEFPLYSVGSKFPDAGWVAYDKCFYTGEQAHVTLRGKLRHARNVIFNYEAIHVLALRWRVPQNVRVNGQLCR